MDGTFYPAMWHKGDNRGHRVVRKTNILLNLNCVYTFGTVSKKDFFDRHLNDTTNVQRCHKDKLCHSVCKVILFSLEYKFTQIIKNMLFLISIKRHPLMWLNENSYLEIWWLAPYFTPYVRSELVEFYWLSLPRFYGSFPLNFSGHLFNWILGRAFVSGSAGRLLWVFGH